MRFSAVIDSMLNNGRERWRRTGWNGKGMWIVLEGAADGEVGTYNGFIAMHTANSDWIPWLASQTDMLAEDWEVVPEVSYVR